MIIIIKLERRNLKIYEFVSEHPATYKGKAIEKLEWINKGWGSTIKKDECIYCGELIPEISSLVEIWNGVLKTLEDDTALAKVKFDITTGSLKEKFRKLEQGEKCTE